MQPVTIGVAGTIKELVKWALTQALILLGVLAFGLSAPLLFTVGIEILVWQGSDMSTWAVVYFFLGPVACMIWMVFICHWHSVRQWQRSGKLDTWRDDHGGMICAVGKSIWFMISGFFGSVLAEGALTYTAHRISLIPGHIMLFFAVAPFAVFAPVLLVLLSRYIRREENATA